MNCKPGDLAVCIYSIDKPWLIGRIVRVVKLAWDLPDHWVVENPPHEWDGRPIAFYDPDLRPIRDPGDDARDETLEWLPVPSKQKEHA